MKNINVILLEDNAFDAQKIQQELESTTELGPFRCRTTDKIDLVKDLVKAAPVDVFLLDLKLGSGSVKDGIENCRRLRQLYRGATIIMRSSFDDPKTVISCLNAGADDFISKATFKGELAIRITRAQKTAAYKRHDSTPPASKSGVVGGFLTALEQRIPRILESAITTVHVRGESGTGKEKVGDLFETALGGSHKLHRLNCAAIAENLMESELFGHKKGAFTGADKDRVGVLEAADNGWVFLDEVACLSTSAQAALLRAIENQEIIPVGASKPKKINVRFLTATNENIEQMVKNQKFRLDLWQRLSERIIEIPPLRERPEEIPELVQHFARTMKGGPYEVSPTLVDILASISWSEGNVRELRNCLRAMTELALDKELTPLALPEKYITDDEDDQALDQLGGKPAGKGQIALSWDGDDDFRFDYLSNKLFFEMIKLASERERLTLRSLSRITGMSRTAVRNKLVALLDTQIATEDGLRQLVGFEN